MRQQFVLLLICCTLGVLALVQPPPMRTIDIGGDMQSGLRDLDTPYVSEFWPVEPRPWTPAQGPAQRWSREAWQIQWPHAGFGWWVATLRIDMSGRDATNPAVITWQQPRSGMSTLVPAPRRYHLVLRTTTTDTPYISASVNPFFSGNDRRGLGIALTQIMLRPLQYQLPGLGFIWLCSCLGWCWWVATRQRWWGIAGALLSTFIYTVYPEWVMIHATSGIWLTAVAIGGSWIIERSTAWSWHKIQLTTLMVWGELLALWSPWLHSSDIAMHVRMLKQVLAGNLLFTAQLPCEAGAYISPYPPLTYMLFAPLTAISSDAEYLRLGLMSTAVICNAIAVLYMAHVVFITPQLQRYQHWFIVLALFNLPLLRAIHTGEISNAIAHGVVTIALVSWVDPRASLWVRITLSSMAMLAHTGNSITFALMAGIMLVQHLVVQRTLPPARIGIAYMVPVGLTAIYYSNYTYLIGQAPGYAGCPPVIPLVNRLSGLYEIVPTALVGAALVGGALLADQRIKSLLIPGIGAALVAIAMLFISIQTVRWGISVVPFLAVAAAWLLSRVWRYGYAGRIATQLSVIVFVWLSYGEIWQRILHYLHD